MAAKGLQNQSEEMLLRVFRVAKILVKNQDVDTKLSGSSQNPVRDRSWTDTQQTKKTQT